MMKKSARFMAGVLSILMFTLVFAGCSTTTAPAAKPTVKVAALKGPSGIGMVKMMEDSKSKTTTNNYVFELSGTPDDIVGKLTSGSMDIAAIPTNLAAVLYNKTGGNIRIAAVGTLGVLYVLEKGGSIKSIADLKGKTIAATGQGSTPEFALNYILEKNGLTPGKDVTVKYLTEHSELTALAVAGKETLVMLPEPFVTTVLTKNTEFRNALDITKEWKAANEKAGNAGSELVMTAIAVRKEFAEKNKAALDTFLAEYKASAAFVNTNPDAASRMVVSQGILAEAGLAKKAIPNCNIVYIDGTEMIKSAQSYLGILMKADPKSVGGKMPNEDFYYKK